MESRKWYTYDRIGKIEMRECAGGGFIARDPEDHTATWYITTKYAKKHYRLEDKAPAGSTFDTGGEVKSKIGHESTVRYSENPLKRDYKEERVTSTEVAACQDEIGRIAFRKMIHGVRGMVWPKLNKGVQIKDQKLRGLRADMIIADDLIQDLMEEYKKRVDEVLGVEIGKRGRDGHYEGGQGMCQHTTPNKGWTDDLDCM